MKAYLTIAFGALDEFICALAGGAPNETVSLRAALGRQRGDRWGCLLCAWLHLTLRQHHCSRTLNHEPMSGFAAVAAAVQLTAVFGAVFYGMPWLIVRCLR